MLRTIEEAIARLEALPELKGKLAYDHFSTAPTLPFAAYLYSFDTAGADDYHGVQWIDFHLELYAENRDISLETKILQIFEDVEIRSDSDYLDDERMYMTTFDFRFPRKLSLS